MVRVAIKSSDILFSRCLYFLDIYFFVMICCCLFCLGLYLAASWMLSKGNVTCFPSEKLLLCRNCFCRYSSFFSILLLFNTIYHLSTLLIPSPQDDLPYARRFFPQYFPVAMCTRQQIIKDILREERIYMEMFWVSTVWILFFTCENQS